jgi:hypothetical protein
MDDDGGTGAPTARAWPCAGSTRRSRSRRFVVNYLHGVQRDLRFVRRYGRPWRSVGDLVPQRFMEVYGTYRGVKASAAEIRRG